MSITKANVQSKYVVITNDTAQHQDLSLEAKGLILLISSRPVDWIFHKNQLMAECNIGRYKLNRIFKELESTGHLAVIQNFDSLGRFSDNEYLFFTDSNDNTAFINTTPLTEKQQPITDYPLTEKPLTENQPLQKKDSLEKKDSTNNRSSSDDRNKMLLDGFEYFWINYPRKIGKKLAKQKFMVITKKLSFDKSLYFIDEIVNDSKKRFLNQDEKFIQHPTTYLNSEVWND